MSTILSRNLAYAVKHPLRTWRVRKACRDHVKTRPICEWCRTLNKPQAHHIVPLWKDDTLGSDANNFITLCDKCHLPIGHNRSFATKYVANVREVCAAKVVIRREE